MDCLARSFLTSIIAVGGDTGLQQSLTDPRAVVSKTDYDLAGRTLQTIAGFVDGVASNSDDQLTTYTYNFADEVTAMTAVLPSSSTTISTAAESGSTVTITTSAAHGLAVGQIVTVSGVGVDGYNGTFTIVSVPTSTTFTYTDGTTGLANSSAGTATINPIQTTGYVYGIGTTAGTDLFSNEILTKTEYPDKTTGAASTSSSDDQSYGYNWQGQKTTMTDQNATTHAYSYDTLGRMTLDDVTTLGSGVDGTVKALGYNFETGGRAYQSTSYGAANLGTFSVSSITHSTNVATATIGSNVYHVGDTVTVAGASPSAYDGTFVVTGVGSNTFTYTMLSTPTTNASGTMTVTAAVMNQVQLAYDGFGQEAIEYLATSGAVNTGSSPSVQYVYTEAAVGQNNDRLMAMEYPNGRYLDYVYGNAEYPITGITRGGTGNLTATATMLSNVYSVGNTVTVSGASLPQYNGTFTITAVNTTNKTFSYTMASAPSGNVTDADITVTTGGTTLDGSISRVTSMMDQAGTSAGVHLEEYTYLGLSTIVAFNRPEANEKMTYIKVTGSPGDTAYHDDGGDGRYTGLDRFGRVSDQFWWSTTTDHTANERFQYAYDRDGNVLYKNNLVNTAFSELYHASSTSSGDNATAYDALNRLQQFRRGTLTVSTGMNNGAGVYDTITDANLKTTFAGYKQTFTLDDVGNQTSVSTDGTAVSRTNNSQNEIGTVGATSIVYDNNGNMTTNDKGYTLGYDAWNRMLTSSHLGLAFKYDALGRQIHIVTSSGNNNDMFHDMWGRLIQSSISLVYTQYVWGLGYVNELIVRDRNADSNGVGNYGKNSSGLEERIYANWDANWNVTSLYRTSGTAGIAERIIYSPYGKPTLLTSAWADFSSSTLFFRILYQGTYWLDEANCQIMGARMESITLGTWYQKDPAGYINGANVYQFVLSRPLSLVDPTGWAGDPSLVPPEMWQIYATFRALGSPVGFRMAQQVLAAIYTMAGGPVPTELPSLEPPPPPPPPDVPNGFVSNEFLGATPRGLASGATLLAGAYVAIKAAAYDLDTEAMTMQAERERDEAEAKIRRELGKRQKMLHPCP